MFKYSLEVIFINSIIKNRMELMKENLSQVIEKRNQENKPFTK